MRPGINFAQRDSAPSGSIPTDTGVGFMAAVTDSGPLVRSVDNFDDWVKTFAALGGAGAAEVFYNSAEGFFRMGGYKLYTSRIAGGAAVTASVVLNDGAVTPAATLRVLANGPGEFGNDYNVMVRTTTDDPNIPAGSFALRVQTDAGVELETSPIFATKLAALLWVNANSRYIVLEDQPSLLGPARTLTAAALSGGVLDVAGITDTQRQASLDRMVEDFGPGQVFMPGSSAASAHNMIKVHAAATGRDDIKDGPDSGTLATLLAAPGQSRDRMGAMFGPWLLCQGRLGTSGQIRTIPPSALIAGLIARNDSLGLSPSAPAAGDNGVFSDFVLGVKYAFSKQDRQTLNAAGFNVIRQMLGGVRVYGWRSTVDPAVDPKWTNFGHARIHTTVVAQVGAVAERFMFKNITPKLITSWGGAITGEVLLPLWAEGGLFGATPEEAFRVDVGPNVNTKASIDNKELRAILSLVESEFGEEITVEIAVRTIKEGVGS